MSDGWRKGRRDGDGEADSRAMGQNILLGFAFGVPLFIKLGLTYLGFRRRAKKAGRIFRKQLIADGVEPKVADILTDDYLRSSELISEIVRAQRAS